jgi:hypothetical protein
LAASGSYTCCVDDLPQYFGGEWANHVQGGTGVADLSVAVAAAETTSSTEYSVVLDTKTKTCTVADKKPKTKTLRIVGVATYRTQAVAESGMKIIKVCIGK